MKGRISRGKERVRQGVKGEVRRGGKTSEGKRGKGGGNKREN